MLRIKKYIYLLAAGTFLVGSGCKKYLDVNKNLNDYAAVPVSILLTGSERAVGNNLSYGGLSGGLSVYTHQQTSRGGADGYGLQGSSGTVEGPWSGLYGAIADLDVIITQATGELRFTYAGIAKILKAYTYSQMVDVWGDIPFSEFNKYKAGIKQPKFDDDAVIYPQLFALINSGIADINNPAANASLPGSDDVIYGGSKAKWIKAANTLKLKLFTQVRKVKSLFPTFTADVTALLASPSTLIAAQADNFVLPYGTTTKDQNPGFGDYSASQRGQNPSPWLYEMLKGINPLQPFSGITDPRLPYYIYNQLPVVAPPTPANCTEYRDGPFVSIYFGSRGPCRDGAQQNSYSMFGIYPVGGRYDDGAGGAASSASGTGAAPYRFITYADRLFLEAELINTGEVSGDARAVFSAALSASMAQVDYVITNFVKPTQTVPALGAQTSYINSILALYDANPAKRLEYIITEKWLSSVGSSVDQYTDYRRTGYPILFDPSNTAMAPGGKAQPPVGGNPLVNPQNPVTVSVTTAFPESLPWSQTEQELNANAPAQKVPSTYKIFWKP